MAQRPSRCRICRRSGDEVLISKRGLCDDCGRERYLSNNHALQDKRGPEYQRWALAYARAAARMAASALDADE